jgi:pyruvate,water dikinase
MAVVVQELVDADASAVAFTLNPVTRDDDEVVINAAFGLGETIVSGSVTPDTIVVAKSGLALKSVEPGEKHLRMVVDRAGGTRYEEGDFGDVAIDETTAVALAELCVGAERAYERPIDVEAAHTRDGWHLLQVRPITT